MSAELHGAVWRVGGRDVSTGCDDGAEVDTVFGVCASACVSIYVYAVCLVVQFSSFCPCRRTHLIPLGLVRLSSV